MTNMKGMSGADRRDSINSLGNKVLMDGVWVGLTPALRESVWRDKLNQAKGTNILQSEKDFIQSVLDDMDKTWFDWNYSGISTINNQVLAITNDAFQTFNSDDVYEIFFVLDDFHPSIPMVGGYDEVNCDCNTGSDYCSWFTSSTCELSCANSSHRGCGTFWRFKCNGSCT